jgi:hypothetical protein
MQKNPPKALTEAKHNQVRSRRDDGKNKDLIMPVPPPAMDLPDGYGEFLSGIKQRVQTERLKAVFSANVAQILMYWDIGNDILGKQQSASWGAKVIDRLATDLKNAFPEMQGFSPRNLKYMRAFAEAWPDRA